MGEPVKAAAFTGSQVSAWTANVALWRRNAAFRHVPEEAVPAEPVYRWHVSSRISTLRCPLHRLTQLSRHAASAGRAGPGPTSHSYRFIVIPLLPDTPGVAGLGTHQADAPVRWTRPHHPPSHATPRS
ncbi:hypothetical protein GCM10010215_26100 [Streptomyces virginiae]|uniref:Uncharacterized protein n=1 Tax=Streptomyces virginiae TaxID=1961 RepID=A0ABQ3NN59_STRVG|nr:hypothetical protein GCM10010215_26100 [Streptomyces virginiae]GHI14211.1 hypothetical protein Scinn_36740 [Streptomyces virginiae]